MADESRTAILSARGVSRQFGSVLANDDVDFDLVPGEIHTLLGENGAGKSTLLSMFGGLYRPDAGTLMFDGKPIRLARPADARALGVSTVHQHFALAPELTVLENIALGTRSRIRLDIERVRQQALPVLARLGLQTLVDDPVRHLSLGERQRLEVAKALVRGSRVLLLDEPTSILSPGEVDGLFAIVRGLALEGTAIAIVTHKLDEAVAISDRITIMRRGRVTGTLSRSEFADVDERTLTNQLIELMFATALPPQPPAPIRSTGRLRLRVDHLTVRDDRGGLALRECSIGLNEGEIVGLAGIDGNGQRELVEAIAGLRTVEAGSISFQGESIDRLSVAERRQRGVICLTDDRTGEGSVADLTVAENLALTRTGSTFWLDKRALERHAANAMNEWSIDAPGPSARTGDLSGGNIQKLILARELSGHPLAIVANKPTHGLDARTAAMIRQKLRDQASDGCAVLLIESDLDDLLPVADRIAVLTDGRIAGEYGRDRFDPSIIGAAMTGGIR